MKHLFVIVIFIFIVAIISCNNQKTKEECSLTQQLQFSDLIGEWHLSDTLITDTAKWELSYTLTFRSDSTLEYYQSGRYGNGGFWTTGVSGTWSVLNDTVFFLQLNSKKNSDFWRVKIMQDSLITSSKVLGDSDSYNYKSVEHLEYKWTRTK